MRTALREKGHPDEEVEAALARLGEERLLDDAGLAARYARSRLQHGGLGQERFIHTRLFEGSPLIRFAVFPLGMDYHLPHHLFPMVPHFRLKKLHALLVQTQPYQQLAPVFPGGFLSVSDS